MYEWLPRDGHVIGKGGAVNWNEGLHSKLRSKLNRLVRRTKGYTKSVEMLKHLLAIALAECLNQPLKSLALQDKNTRFRRQIAEPCRCLE